MEFTPNSLFNVMIKLGENDDPLIPPARVAIELRAIADKLDTCERWSRETYGPIGEEGFWGASQTVQIS